MGSDDLPASLLGQLRAADLRRYALATGWRRDERVNGQVALFNRPEADLDQLVVPAEGTDPDGYALLAGEAVRKLAEWERRPARAVLNDLLLPPADILRFRTDSDEAAGGSLPLEAAVQLLTGAKHLLAATAHSALDPKPYYPRLRRAEAEDLVVACRVGQTERGSFTVAVACPLDLPPAGPLLAAFPLPAAPAAEAPFRRRVTRLLVRSLNSLAEAADRHQVEALRDLDRHPGLSANFCEALAQLRPAGERASVAVSPTWSRAWPAADEERRTPPTVTLRQEAFEAAEYLAPVLRPTPAGKVDWHSGFVEELRGGSVPEEAGPSGEVWLSVWDSGGLMKARAYLAPDQYAVAARAHLTSDQVTFTGVLRRGPRFREIDNVGSFELLRLPAGAPTGNGSAAANDEVAF